MRAEKPRSARIPPPHPICVPEADGRRTRQLDLPAAVTLGFQATPGPIARMRFRKGAKLRKGPSKVGLGPLFQIRLSAFERRPPPEMSQAENSRHLLRQVA